MIKKIKSFFKKWKETNKLQREIEREEKIERLKKNKLYGDYDEQDQQPAYTLRDTEEPESTIHPAHAIRTGHRRRRTWRKQRDRWWFRDELLFYRSLAAVPDHN